MQGPGPVFGIFYSIRRDEGESSGFACVLHGPDVGLHGGHGTQGHGSLIVVGDALRGLEGEGCGCPSR